MVARRSHLNRQRPGAGSMTGLLAPLLGCLLACSSPTGPPGGSAAPAGAARDALYAGARQLSFEGRRSGEGYFSRDGSQLVFQSEREPGNPFYQIYRMNLRDGEVDRLSTGVGKTTCGWIHPSGSRALFASTHLDPESEALQRQELARRESGPERRYAWDYDSHYDLFSVGLPPGDTAPRRLTSAPGYDAEASWSPDARRIVFASNRHIFAKDGSLSAELSAADRERAERDPSYFIDLYTLDERSGTIRRLTETPGYDGGPFFSPDGKRIVFRRFSEDGATAEIYSMNSDGSDVRQLTQLAAMSWAPFYHPSGDYVIFSSNPEGMANFELYLVDSEGSRPPARVTERDGFDGLPVFSPDGDTLVFTRRPGGGQSQLYTARWNDSAARERLGLPAPTLDQVGPLLPIPSDLSAAIQPSDLRAFVDALASPEADGRLTGSAGERIATGYVARVFRSLGLEPAGDDAGYFQDFGFTAGVSLGPGNRLQAGSADGSPIGPEPRLTEWTLDRDWRPLAFSRVGPVPASEIAFAGYGLVAPATDAARAIDDYAHLDVSDRWVLVFRYVPEKLSAEARRHYRRHATLRYKAMIARDRGARGILFVSGPNSRVRDELVDLRFDATLSGTSIAVVSLSDAAADALIRAGSGHELADLQSTLDRGIAMPGFQLEGVQVGAEIDIEQQRKRGRNVLARLPAAAPSEEPRPVILLGAHVDHLGHGETSGSLAHARAEGDGKGELHPGADDNASGVAALLEIAAFLADARARGEFESVRDVEFAAWSGEELGLLGSSAYADALAASLPGDAGSEALSGAIAAYLNLDMVGRLREVLSLFGVDSSPVWRREIERRNAPIGLAVEALGDSYVPTDATTFYLKGVPVLSAFSGSHEDYHTPRDIPEHLDYVGLADIARLIGGIAASLAVSDTAPPYVATAAPARGPPRAGLRVYLGTIPDYTDRTPNHGLLLSGVARGGPAERAGLRAGDAITRVADRVIENIYDYTYSLDELEVGEPVEVRARRGDEELRFTLTPASRD